MYFFLLHSVVIERSILYVYMIDFCNSTTKMNVQYDVQIDLSAFSQKKQTAGDPLIKKDPTR